MKLNLRKIWLKVHLYLGLTAGLVFAMCGLTGSVLVFEHALDEQLNSNLLVTKQSGERLPLSKIIAAAEAAHPDLPTADRVGISIRKTGVCDVRLATRGEGAVDPEATEVFVDPYTAEVLGSRVRGSGLLRVIYKLHATLLAGKTGEAIIGTVGILVLISIATGIYLWWPLLKAGRRAAWGIRSQKLNFDLHKVTGVAFTPILALIAFTGVYFAFPALIKPVVTVFSNETKQPPKLKSKKPAKGIPSIGPDQAVAIATQAFPQSKVMSVELPQNKEGIYRVFVRQQGEVGELRGAGRILIDQFTGDILATRDWSQFTFADTYFRIQIALHSGDAFGIIGRWLFCIAGLMPATLYITGFSLWWRKLRSRRRQQRTQVVQPREVKPDGEALITTSV